MTDQPDAPAETPMQRALRMKRTALGAKPKVPGANTFVRGQAAGIAPGASKPALRK